MRCNVGVNVKYLTDQWLIAEYRELPMVVGSLRHNKWKIKSASNDDFNLGKGHLNFFKTRLLYLKKRHSEVIAEMIRREFEHTTLMFYFHLVELDSNCPKEYWNDWKPTMEDSIKIRERLKSKIISNSKLPITWWRYNRINLTNETLDSYLDNIINGELYFV